MNKKSAILLMLLSALSVNAQEGPAMADQLRENGKIYVVIGVISIVFLAIVAFLLYIEKRLKRLEEQLKKE